ncbi:hypothetical protein BCU70_20830 [Vibrio sp. 10N.286.49.C2]|uniref:hypothetical protein n=1 Tax=unclassified Vibrio TaxID=2614977 RepID=UPI000C859467|nr:MULTISPECIES: hypothetical protein [unclassified Vibrio]PMH33186.1 hypothetical protein BCU70_20830 [Vibrio sp. 10N.286.49.C2]PMH51200.1 hypothetical protein BCU66_17390 [Vibrio sp. 10N.286.49.B1]PMH81962.1 hypothetical protein BCU58_19680 [Vibrio sp. 10N.286.48.B7]
MPTNYCAACKKKTAHKAVMKRSPNESTSILQSFQQLMSQLVSGSGYYKMERHIICRVCNQENQVEAKPVLTQQANLA